MVISSLDFEAWYKSFEPEKAGEIIRKRLEKTPASVKVDDLELARFLKVVLTEDEIEHDGLEDLLHTVKEGETKPRLTDQEITGGDQFRNGPRSKLLPPQKNAK